MPRQNLKFIYMHGAALRSVLLVFIHQSIIAGAAIFLTEVIQRFQQGENIVFYLALYLGSMLIPYLPGCWSLVELQKWINAAHGQFVQMLKEAMLSHQSVHTNAALKMRASSVISKNSFSVVREYIEFLHDLLSFFLNSGLSIVVMAFLLPRQLIMGYVASCLVSFVMVAMLQKMVATTAAKLEASYIVYADTLDRSWENLIIRNTYNIELWDRSRQTCANDFYGLSNKLQVIKQCGNVFLSVAALGPTIYLVFSLVVAESIQSAVLAAVVVNLTRIFLILNSFSALAYKFLDFGALTARLGVLSGILAELSVHDNISEHSSGTKLNGVGVAGHDEVMSALVKLSAGRLLLSGKNGSGKTTLMMQLKHRLGASSFFLPAHHDGLTWQRDVSSFSTGQRVRARLEEIMAVDGIKYYLLDEWDANLDKATVEEINGLIEKLAQTRIVLEIRH
jgi:hypothetical protein